MLNHLQVPECWKVLSFDSHVQCHTWDCQLRMSVHNATYIHVQTVCLYSYLCIFFMQFNVKLLFQSQLWNRRSGNWCTKITSRYGNAYYCIVLLTVHQISFFLVVVFLSFKKKFLLDFCCWSPRPDWGSSLKQRHGPQVPETCGEDQATAVCGE